MNIRDAYDRNGYRWGFPPAPRNLLDERAQSALVLALVELELLTLEAGDPDALPATYYRDHRAELEPIVQKVAQANTMVPVGLLARLILDELKRRVPWQKKS